MRQIILASQEVLTTAGRGFYQANAFIFGKALVHCIFLVDISGYGDLSNIGYARSVR